MGLNLKDKADTAVTVAEAAAVFGEYLVVSVGGMAMTEVKREVVGTADVLLRHLLHPTIGQEEPPQLPPGVIMPISQVIDRQPETVT